MKKVIYKYALTRGAGMSRISLPKGAQILRMNTQRDDPYLWCLVDPLEEAEEERIFQTFATGEEFTSAQFEYIGTYSILEDMLLFHVFEYIFHNKIVKG